jgi:hypothetical protein
MLDLTVITAIVARDRVADQFPRRAATPQRRTPSTRSSTAADRAAAPRPSPRQGTDAR